MCKISADIPVGTNGTLTGGVEVINIRATSIGHRVLACSADKDIIAKPSDDRVVTAQTGENIIVTIAR